MTPKPPVRTPLHEVFDRIHRMGFAALLTVPFVGPDLADFFERTIFPIVLPRRDRVLTGVYGGVKSIEAKFHLALLRLLPLPPPLPPSRESDPSGP